MFQKWLSSKIIGATQDDKFDGEQLMVKDVNNGEGLASVVLKPSEEIVKKTLSTENKWFGVKGTEKATLIDRYNKKETNFSLCI